MRYLIASLLLFSVVFLSAQQEQEIKSLKELPVAFIIGEYDYMYAELYEEHPGILLEVCDNSLDAAFEKWLHMIYAVEDYSKQIDFDLNGLKIWLNVFWAEDGTIDNVAYYLKPNSRHVKDAEIRAFFKSFVTHYRLPIDAGVAFNHSGSASFPTFGNSPQEVKKD